MLEHLHAAQGLQGLWAPEFKVTRLVDYLCKALEDHPAHVRQEAVLLLKRYVKETAGKGHVPLQAEMLTIHSIHSHAM